MHRTQEVAGSSPASSTSKGRNKFWRAPGAPCRVESRRRRSLACATPTGDLAATADQPQSAVWWSWERCPDTQTRGALAGLGAVAPGPALQDYRLGFEERVETLDSAFTANP
jgi:hypothetical protein